MPSIRKESIPRGSESPNPKLLKKENGADTRDVEANSIHSGNSLKPSETDDPELLANTPQKRNWRGILLALLVIAVISSIIVTASILTTPREPADNYGKPYTFSDFIHMNKWFELLSYKIVKDGIVYLSHTGDLVYLNQTTMTQRTLLPRHSLNEWSTLFSNLFGQKRMFNGLFSVSSDLSGILLQYGDYQTSRINGPNKYDAVQVPGLKIFSLLHLTSMPLGDLLLSVNPEAFSFARHVYVHLNLFDDTLSTILNITQGMPDEDIQYGVADWMYGEEIMRTNVAVWWNPSATRIAFLAFDERNVTNVPILLFGVDGGTHERVHQHKYPQAGNPSPYGNPRVSLWIYDIETRERREFERPASIPWDGHFMFERWYNPDTLIVCWSDRTQTQAWITVVSWTRNSSWVIYKTSANNGWVDMTKQANKEPLVHEKTQSLFIILPREYTEKAYRGIARLRVDLSGRETQQTMKWMITPDFDISDILHFNGDDEFLFLGTGPDPKHSHLYWGKAGGDIACLTCGNPNCTYNRAKVSRDGHCFVQECRGPDPPTYILYTINRTTDISGAVTSVEALYQSTLMDNIDLKQLLWERAMPRTEFISLTVREGTRDQLELRAKLLVPPELNKTHIIKYPLLLYTYGGPSRQLVTTKFTLDWTAYLAATAKVLVLMVDGRGSTGYGQKFEHQVYKKLGLVEVEDQLDAVKAFIKHHSYVNTSQIGAYGWSYGGFTVAHLLGHPENNLTRCGVAVAPVTDFKYYDTVYTERHLGRIIDNPDAYLQTQVARNARNFRSKSVLLMHGTADDNVLMINTASLATALINANADVDVMIYPDDNHSVQRASNSEHLYRKATTFLLDCFNKSSIRYSIDLRVKDDL
ncbi:hypothetical protein CRM22_007904 [Opisthorchis felineus]|uniref:Peptidase S9 prolyl oligopeptidase catalytic domain-containing protein n=1 Tax=Opisthorchis felineus TaxID=147828 RepID=A0A4S2LM30_OPIFE|nr:hypothetical protein CRM22_007904 [Opisthorchis felineus]